jgi:hypothetical protein
MSKIFSAERVAAVQAQFPSFTTAQLVNFLAEGAVGGLSNGIMSRLEAGDNPRHLRFGLQKNCCCLCCYAWQIVEVTDDGTETIVEETEDLTDWIERG